MKTRILISEITGNVIIVVCDKNTEQMIIITKDNPVYLQFKKLAE